MQTMLYAVKMDFSYFETLYSWNKQYLLILQYLSVITYPILIVRHPFGPQIFKTPNI